MIVYRKFALSLLFIVLLTSLEVKVPASSYMVGSPFSFNLPLKMSYKTFQLETVTKNGSLTSYGEAKYLSLDVDGYPMGILYSSGCVYIAVLMPYSNPDLVHGIVKVNVSDLTYTIYKFPWEVDRENKYYGPCAWTLAFDSKGYLWISIRDYGVTPAHPPSLIPHLAKLNVSSATLYIYYVPQGIGNCDVKFYNGTLWAYGTKLLAEIDVETEEIVGLYNIGVSSGFLALDESENCLWISGVDEGFVKRFNMLSKNVDLTVSGLDRPLGLFVDSKFVYVAENSNEVGADETIALIDKFTGNVSRVKTGVIISNQGTYYVMKSSLGNLWWTDNSKHFGVILPDGETKFCYESISYFCYFMADVPGGSIWFSVKGSSLIGMFEEIRVFNCKGGLSFSKKLHYLD